MSEIQEFLSPQAQKQVEQYKKDLEDISKDYASIAASVDKLDKEQKQEVKTQQQLTTRQKEALKLQKQLRSTTAKREQANSKLNKELVKQKVALQQTNKAMRDQAKASLGIKKSNGLFKSMTKSILTAGAAMLSFRAAAKVFSTSIKTIANFEQAMSKVRAVTGALPKDFKTLSADAKRLGSETSKSATEVAGLQLEFAKLGFSTAEIINATEATIQLSIAAGSDLADSAKVAASTVKGFGLNAAETQRVVDVMAKSFSSSALDLSKFETAMSAVAPVAKASGKDIEFTTARLSLLADSGLDASTAGTSLRNMFLELNKQGLTWEEGLEAINTSTNKNNTALKMFGKRGATAALILADNVDAANELEKAYDGAAGSAQEMATIMEDNLIGDVSKLSSAWEGFILGLNKGEGVLSQFFRDAVQLVTKLVGAIETLTKSENERKEDAIQESINIKKEEYLKKLSDELKRKKLLKNEDEARNDLIDEEIERVKWIIDFNKKRSEEEADQNLELSYALDKTVKTYEGYLNILGGLKTVKKELVEENKKETDSAKKRNKILIDGELDYLEKQKVISDFVRKEAEERLGSKIESEADFTSRINSELSQRYDENKKYLEKIKQDEVDYYDIKKQLLNNYKDTAIDAVMAIYDFQLTSIDNDLENTDAYYQTKIQAQSNLGESTVQLETEYNLKRQQLEDERAKKEKQQAIINIGISTAEGAFDITKNALALTSAAALNPLLAPLIPFAWAQLGLLGIASGAQLAAVSQFDDGTGSTPSTYIAGEKRPEFRKHNGQWSLLTEPTLFTDSAGDQIISGAETDQILKGASMQGNTGNSAIDTERIVRAIENNTPSMGISKGGLISVSKKNGSIKRYLNENVRH